MANLQIEHLQHQKSNIVEDGKPKLPSSTQLEYGEIAINYADGVETMAIKNSNNDIITFSNDNSIDKKIEAVKESTATKLELEDGVEQIKLTETVGEKGEKIYYIGFQWGEF